MNNGSGAPAVSGDARSPAFVTGLGRPGMGASQNSGQSQVLGSTMEVLRV